MYYVVKADCYLLIPTSCKLYSQLTSKISFPTTLAWVHIMTESKSTDYMATFKVNICPLAKFLCLPLFISNRICWGKYACWSKVRKAAIILFPQLPHPDRWGWCRLIHLLFTKIFTREQRTYRTFASPQRAFYYSCGATSLTEFYSCNWMQVFQRGLRVCFHNQWGPLASCVGFSAVCKHNLLCTLPNHS